MVRLSKKITNKNSNKKPVKRSQSKRVNSKNSNNKKMLKNNNKKNLKRRLRKNKKGGYRVTMPSEYFGGNSGKYTNSPVINPHATSHGSLSGKALQTNINLKPYGPQGSQKGGAPLPIEFFGGNSGRYFEAGAPELKQCTNAYGRHIAHSHGVVMDPPHNGWMAPNLAANPEFRDLTGGGRKGTKRNSKKSNKKNTKKARKSKKNNNSNVNKKYNKNKNNNKRK